VACERRFLRARRRINPVVARHTNVPADSDVAGSAAGRNDRGAGAYAAHEGNGKVQPTGSSFRRESYGIAFPPDSPYRKAVNTALLDLKEDGPYDRLYTKWFGAGQ
jgi:hypothetical protein